MWTLWCVESLIFFKVPLCVGFVVCGEFDFFQSSPVWGYCTSMDFSTVVQRLLTFKKTPCAGEFSPVVEKLIIFEKNPCAGDFLAPFSPKKTLKV